MTIAAASTYADEPGSCGTLAGNAALWTQAQARAEAIQTDNRSDAITNPDPGAIDVRCGSVNGIPNATLEVEWSSRAVSNVGLGGVFGADEITSTRSAIASLGVPSVAGYGLRPFFMCSLDLPAAGEILPTKVHRIGGVTNGGDYTPGCPEPSGNWWTVDCPENAGNNSDSAFRATIRDGCAWPVRTVDNPVPAPPNPAGLLLACPPDPDPVDADDCLGANPGTITNQQANTWKDVIDAGDRVILPVFCGSPDCAPAAIVGEGGNNAEYPIFALASMRVCGYHFGNKDYQVTTGTCGNNPDGWVSTTGNSQTHYMLAVFEQVQITGSVLPPECALGDPACDGGLRQTYLVG